MYWEFMVPAAGIIMLLLAVTAVISLSRQKNLAPGMRFLCLLGILGFPVLGPAVWFFHRFRGRRARPLDASGSAGIASSRTANRR